MRLLTLVGLNDAFLFLRKYQELSDGEKYRFKLSKGYPRLYDRHVIDVIRQDTGEIVQAFVYRMLAHYRPTPPNDYYFNVIVKGYRNWDVDADLNSLERIRFEFDHCIIILLYYSFSFSVLLIP